MNKWNNRVLVIDDDKELLEFYENLLKGTAPDSEESDACTEAFALLFAAEAVSADSFPPAEQLFAEEVSLKDSMSDASFWFRLDPVFVSSGMEALEKLNEALLIDKPFAMAICDVKMPGWDGIKTIEELRKRDPKLRVTFVSAYADAGYFEVNRRVGGDFHFFTKPIKPMDLCREVNCGVIEWNSVWSDLQFSRQLEASGALSPKDFRDSLLETLRRCVGSFHIGQWKKSLRGWIPIENEVSRNSPLQKAVSTFFPDTGAQALSNFVTLEDSTVAYMYAISSDSALVLEFEKPLSPEKSYYLDVSVLGLICAGVFLDKPQVAETWKKTIAIQNDRPQLVI
jgi:CheY-like chemotaxis protein